MRDPDIPDPKLRRFAGLLENRGPELGLVGENDRSRVWERHVEDCLRAAAVVQSSDRTSYDLGSGGGLPGIVVAIARPGLEVRLVEAKRRRVAWLEMVIDELAIKNASVLPTRVEGLTEPVDVCFARAFAPLARSWELAEPVLHRGGRLVYFAGRNQAEDEALELSPDVRVVRESLLDSAGALVIIGKE
jgi:16S rRNA (guanine527-N7)-methyltransferase